MNMAERRSRGRPPGAKNRNKLLSGERVATVCDYYKFNPTVFLVQVANGTDTSEEWTKDDRMRAASKLHDSIHGNRSFQLSQDDPIDGQFEIVFIEAATDLCLPGEATAAILTQPVRPEPL
jgi:4-hydroxy-L-threonine phosphate dehydrogenase PdxA